MKFIRFPNSCPSLHLSLSLNYSSPPLFDQNYIFLWIQIELIQVAASEYPPQRSGNNHRDPRAPVEI